MTCLFKNANHCGDLVTILKSSLLALLAEVKGITDFKGICVFLGISANQFHLQNTKF